MTAWLRAIGVWPPLVATATFATLLVATFAGADPGVVRATGAVPAAWLDALAALRAGDAGAALRQFALAESQIDAAPPALLRARLHAALLGNDGIDAETTAEKLALRDPAAEDVRSFVLGVAAFARSRRTALQAQQPGADPGAFDRAMRDATLAAAAFADASLAHDGRDWPAARRNAERALAWRAELQRQKEQAERDRKQAQEPQQPQPEPEPEPIEQELRQPDDAGRLSAAELQALLQRLAAAEDEKRAVRRARRDLRSAGVEQDW